MKSLIKILALFFTLAGCTAEYEAGAAASASQAARSADNALKASEWAWCKAPSHGAVMRRYAANKSLWKARLRICWPELVQ